MKEKHNAEKIMYAIPFGILWFFMKNNLSQMGFLINKAEFFHLARKIYPSIRVNFTHYKRNFS